MHVAERADQVAHQLHASAARLLPHAFRQRAVGAILQQHVHLIETVHQSHQLQDAGMAQPLEHPRLVEVRPDLTQQLLVADPLHHDALLAGAPLGQVDALECAEDQRVRHGVGRRVYQRPLHALLAPHHLAGQGLLRPLLHHQLAQVQAVLRGLRGELGHLLEVPLLVRARHQQRVFFAKSVFEEVHGARPDVAQHHSVEHRTRAVGAHRMLRRGPVQRELARPELQRHVHVAAPAPDGGGPDA
mmetsp:Transcript_78547/g.243663  ORF Transcript_78547/g.243663 Transcript_78547/m.243663 type:complete len:244 (+) Transcript_78547:392-1123(+)